MTEKQILNYIISEKNYDKKIYPFLRKLAEFMRTKTSEFYYLDEKIITREREVIHHLYNGIKVTAILDKNRNMVVSMPQNKDKKLINKLEKLAINK